MKIMILMLGFLMFGISAQAEMRVWTNADGKTYTGEYVTWMGGNVIVKTERGRQKKLPFSELSEADQSFVELENPPALKIEFSYRSKSVSPPKESPFVNLHFPVEIFDYVFEVEMKQTSTKPYNHELRVEYFAIGDEIDGDNRVLLQRNESRFTLTKENERNHSFSGESMRIENKSIWPDAPMRGIKYNGYLVIVTDEQGKVIQHKETSKYFYGIADKLREFPVGKRFDKQGERTWPPRPTFASRNPYRFK